MSKVRVLLADDHGIEAAAQILKRDPSVRVIILSMYDDEEYLVRALSAGVKGYLLKDSAQIDMVRAVQSQHGRDRALRRAQEDCFLSTGSRSCEGGMRP